MHEQEGQTGSDAGPPGGRWGDELEKPIDAVKRVVLAGLGAVAVATEASDEIFGTLVKKGEQARDEVMREIRDARERNAGKRSQSEAFVRARMDTVLGAVNLASKGDVEALNAKLNIINRKLDEVQAAKAGSPPPGPNPGSPPEPPGSGGAL